MGRVDVAVVGTVNLDTTIHVPRLAERGETVVGDDATDAPGGKAANQAVAAARQGARTALVGVVGDDPAADTVLAFLTAEPRLDATGVGRVPGAATGRALIAVDDHGGNTVTTSKGANAHLDDAHVHRFGKMVGDAAVVLVQLGVPIDAVRAALEIARGVGTLAILDPAPADQLVGDEADALLRSVDVITPNESEAARLIGRPVESERDARDAARQLMQRGCASVVITLAGRGAFYASPARPDGMLVAPHAIDPDAAVDPTGAGDAFCGALAAALARGADVDDALRDASVAGALATTVRGAAPSMPTQAAVRTALSRSEAPEHGGRP
jgi:ribokinase